MYNRAEATQMARESLGMACVLITHRETADGRLKKTLKRTQDGARIAFSAFDFEKTIGQLRLSINELTGLREQISELHNPKPRVPIIQTKAPRREDWNSLIKIRRASKALHEALVRKWKCCQPGHTGHAVKLFVETYRVDGEVQLNLAILCRARTWDMVQSTLVQLEVRSQNIETPRLPGKVPTPDGSRFTPRQRLEVVKLAQETTFETPDQIPQNKAPGHFGSVLSIQSTIRGSCDLDSPEDICRKLTQQLEASCLDHLNTSSDEAFRHLFYPAKTCFCGGFHVSSQCHVAVPMYEALDESSSDHFFPTVERLKLARSLVLAVLRLHSTPWLGDFWTLRGLAFFITDQGGDVSQALRSLHVGFEFAQRLIDSTEGVESPSELPVHHGITENERLFCGIGNLSLHSLGAALLQIDRRARVEPRDVLAVRKMALRPSDLGPRYTELTRKCLWCDFGQGSSLAEPRLQEAIHRGVVDELDVMISSLG
ncbi:hypothetical protein LX36DRAFT_747613 [Colletotrichum falcatum]|nr:hypothetical protein LX36DRAFT_747613 [Colletotrichum falcatum]